MEETLLVVAVAAVTVCVGAAVDAARLPSDAWDRSGKSRTTWIVLPVVFCLGVIGPILAVIYVLHIRPQVVAAVDAPDLGGTSGLTF